MRFDPYNSAKCEFYFAHRAARVARNMYSDSDWWHVENADKVDSVLLPAIDREWKGFCDSRVPYLICNIVADKRGVMGR